MTEEEKREMILKKFGYYDYEHEDNEDEDEDLEILYRKPKKIAKRIVILIHLIYVSKNNNEKEKIIDFFKKEKLWKSLSKNEKKILKRKNELKEKDIINLSWKIECVYVLLWSINKVDKLTKPKVEINHLELFNLLPNFFTSPQDFIDSSKLRSKKELDDYSDEIYDIHWKIRDAELNNKNKTKYNQGVVYERHYAMNWLVYFKGDNWDNITTDT